MRKELRLLIAVISLVLAGAQRLSAFTQQDIVSPVPGKWANLQALVLNNTDSSDLYYSLVSDDPLDSGLAYDGPVVIDEKGPVTLHITAVDKQGMRTDFTVSYEVTSAPAVASGEAASLFIQNINLNPIRKYTSGTMITIPAEFKYSMGSDIHPSLSGKPLTVSALNKLERYLPCTITDGTSMWRFIIHTVAASSDLVSGRQVPFELVDWDTFVYTGEKLIYQIDDAYWSADREPVKLDRSVKHTIRWQSIEYEFGNPVETYELPVKPTLAVRKEEKGPVTFYIPDNSNYLLGPAVARPDSGTIASGLYPTVSVDTFDGDMIGGRMVVGVFYDNVYQGTLESTYLIDHQPPSIPLITSSSAQSYARNKVTISISAEPDADLYYALSSPLLSDTGFEGTDAAVFDRVEQGTFTLYDGIPLVLQSEADKAAFYKVNAYAVDKQGNKSAVAEYQIVVDEYNYFLSPKGGTIMNKSVAEEPDGSFGNPFVTFAQAVKAINSLPYTRLHITGDVTLDAGTVLITSNCKLVGSNTHIVIPQNSCIKVTGATFESQGCLFEKQVKVAADRNYMTDEDVERLQRMFIVKNGTLSLSSGELIGVFSSDGILVDADASTVSFADCGMTVQADSYACGVSAVDTKVFVTNQRATSVAQTCVCYSIHGGTFSLAKSSCTVIGHLGRIGEFSRTKATVSGNSFTGTISSKTSEVTPLWKDVDTVLVQKDNASDGF